MGQAPAPVTRCRVGHRIQANSCRSSARTTMKPPMAWARPWQSHSGRRANPERPWAIAISCAGRREPQIVGSRSRARRIVPIAEMPPAVSFILRDKDCGPCNPERPDPSLDEDESGFRVTLSTLAKHADRAIASTSTAPAPCSTPCTGPSASHRDWSMRPRWPCSVQRFPTG